MHLLPIIHRTHPMSIHHLIVERTNLSLKIDSIFHLLFPETQRVNILSSHLPLCMIHQTMRMSMNSLIFLIIVVVIYLLLYSITMLIQSSLIFQSHLFMMIYLSMKSKPRRLSRYLSSSLWLCQTLVVLRLVSLQIRKLLKHPRLLITHLYALKIKPTHKFFFLHLNHMITSLTHWMNHTQQTHLWGIICLSFSCFIVYFSQESAHTYHLHAVCYNTMLSPQRACLVLSLFSFLWTY